MILSAPFGHVITLKRVAMRKTQLAIVSIADVVNSTSTAPLIGLPPKGAKFCHTLNIC
jgi:hypothetical protein